jgi:uncharacterized membrane protein
MEDASMLGIPGLDPAGAVHAALGLAAVAAGTAMVLMDKGTRAHRVVGRLFALLLVTVNATSFLLYDLLGRWGPFHSLAVVNLLTLGCGMAVVWLQQPRGWLGLHGRFMAWAYAGLLAAFVSEVAVRVPGIGFLPGVVGGSLLVVSVAAVLIHVQVPRIVARQS